MQFIGLGALRDQEIKDASFLGIQDSRAVVAPVMLVRAKIEGWQTTLNITPTCPVIFLVMCCAQVIYKKIKP
jgi:hypothetical protein